jgi:hypothetical protein
MKDREIIYPVEQQYQDVIINLHRDLYTFCKRLGIYEDEAPYLVVRRSVLVDLLVSELPPEKRLGARETILRELLSRVGKCFPRLHHKIIYVAVNPSHLKPYSEYQNTLCHELLHYRDFTLKRGPKFDKLVEDIILGKKTLKRTRLYLDPILPDNTALGSRPNLHSSAGNDGGARNFDNIQ